MKPYNNKPATAALEAFVSSSFPKSGISLRGSFQTNSLEVDMQDLFNAVTSDNELSFPDITWESSDEEEEEVEDNPFLSRKPSMGMGMVQHGFAMHRHSLGQATNNLRALARSKTLRTSISSLGGPATHHLGRQV